jgi:virulence factor Mce-like protein
MRRLLATALVLAACGALVLLATGASNGGGAGRYWVELDNAFGLIGGGDLKIAGVRAGRIGELKIDPRTHRALVEIEITKTGFGSLRTDTTCESRPQSLIGEYFIDCQPGTAPQELKAGATIPVSHTASTVAPDLVNDIMRLPYRQRLSVIVNELGAAVAGNAQNLNEAIKRASPGLRETDKVLKVLGDQNQVLADLVTNADKVIGDLSDNRKEVARWVVQAGNTARASAQRRTDIAAGFHKLPGFLEQLQPAMKSLGSVADEQTPALRTLQLASRNLKRFFDDLGPFANASRPAFQALGKASATGTQAVQAAASTVAELNQFSTGAPELAKNLAIVLEHLDDRRYSVENDPRSPGGKGYTGLEALLQYTFDQVQSVNIYDQSVHILKVAPFPSDCANYADVAHAKPLLDKCSATLGPLGAGINYADSTKPSGADARAKTRARREKIIAQHRPAEPQAPQQPGASDAQPGQQQAPAPALPQVPAVPPVQLPPLPHNLPDLGSTGPSPPGGDQRTRNDQLLDYLLRP